MPEGGTYFWWTPSRCKAWLYCTGTEGVLADLCLSLMHKMKNFLYIGPFLGCLLSCFFVVVFTRLLTYSPPPKAWPLSVSTSSWRCFIIFQVPQCYLWLCLPLFSCASVPFIFFYRSMPLRASPVTMRCCKTLMCNLPQGSPQHNQTSKVHFLSFRSWILYGVPAKYQMPSVKQATVNSCSHG